MSKSVISQLRQTLAGETTEGSANRPICSYTHQNFQLAHPGFRHTGKPRILNAYFIRGKTSFDRRQVSTSGEITDSVDPQYWKRILHSAMTVSFIRGKR